MTNTVFHTLNETLRDLVRKKAENDANLEQLRTELNNAADNLRKAKEGEKVTASAENEAMTKYRDLLAYSNTLSRKSLAVSEKLTLLKDRQRQATAGHEEAEERVKDCKKEHKEAAARLRMAEATDLLVKDQIEDVSNQIKKLRVRGF